MVNRDAGAVEKRVAASRPEVNANFWTTWLPKDAPMKRNRWRSVWRGPGHRRTGMHCSITSTGVLKPAAGSPPWRYGTKSACGGCFRPGPVRPGALVNGDFLQPPMNRGFDWRLASFPGLFEAPTRGLLKVTFSRKRRGLRNPEPVDRPAGEHRVPLAVRVLD